MLDLRELAKIRNAAHFAPPNETIYTYEARAAVKKLLGHIDAQAEELKKLHALASELTDALIYATEHMGIALDRARKAGMRE